MRQQDLPNRRHFLEQVGAGTAGIWATNISSNAAFAETSSPVKKSVADQVALGKSGVKVSRLGMGTGSQGGQVQRELSQDAFTKLLRHGIDQGVTFIDTADTYQELHEKIRPAIKGIDREKIQIQCKIPSGKYDDPLKELDRFRKEIGTDYFDTFLIHCVRTTNWPEELKALRDLLDEAKEKGLIRATGVSMHGLLPLKAAAKCDWGDLRLVRINHNGTKMDGPRGDWQETGDVEQVTMAVEQMHNRGKGVLGMKLIGNGSFTTPDDRQKAVDFVFGLGTVDAVVIGFKSPAEIDESIMRINQTLAKGSEATLTTKSVRNPG